MATLGLRCCTWAFSSCGEQGLLFVVVHGLLIAVACLVAEHGLQVHRLQQLWHVGFSSCGSRALERRLSSCGARAQLLHGMWDLPGPGLEPTSPALAGGFLTTVPPGKSRCPPLNYFVQILLCFIGHPPPWKDMQRYSSHETCCCVSWKGAEDVGDHVTQCSLRKGKPSLLALGPGKTAFQLRAGLTQAAGRHRAFWGPTLRVRTQDLMVCPFCARMFLVLFLLLWCS